MVFLVFEVEQTVSVEGKGDVQLGHGNVADFHGLSVQVAQIELVLFGGYLGDNVLVLGGGNSHHEDSAFVEEGHCAGTEPCIMGSNRITYAPIGFIADIEEDSGVIADDDIVRIFKMVINGSDNFFEYFLVVLQVVLGNVVEA